MNIHGKLLNIQSELKAPKGQFNSFGKYNYRSCEDILEALKPLLVKNKATLKIGDEIIHLGDRYYIKATATLTDIESGESVSTNAFAREEETKKGMDASQITGSTSSYARKYALNGLFAIDDTKDSDFTNKHEEKENDAPKKLSEAQVKRLFAIANNKGFTVADVKKAIVKDYNKINAEDLTKQEYDELCNRLENAGKAG